MKKQYKYLILSIAALIIAILGNQIILQYYIHIYWDKSWFWKIYTPIEAYKLTKHLLTSVGTDAGENVLIVTFLSGFVTYIAGLVIWRLFKPAAYSERYGTARWEAVEVIKETSLIDEPEVLHPVEGRYGIFIGSYEDKPDIGRRIVRYDTKEELYLNWLAHFGSQHIMLFAPTGSGKGVGVVIPTLLNYPSSVLVYDLKGENYEKTAGYRKKQFNSVCIKFAPGMADGTSARFNPLDTIRVGTVYEMKDAQKIALMLVDQEGEGLKDFWLKSAWDLMCGAILHIIYTKKVKSLGSLALFLNGVDPDTKDGYPDSVAWLKEMCDQENIHVEGYAKLKGITNREAEEHLRKVGLIGDDGVNVNIKAASAKLAGGGEKVEGQRKGTIDTANGVLSLYKDPIVAANTSVSDFKLEDLQGYDKPVSLFIVVPNDDRDRLRPIVRLLITLSIQVIQASMHGKLREVLYLIDEFPELKKIDEIPSAMATIRGYQVRMLLVIQDYAQLKAYYGDLAQSVFSNCGIRIAYSSNEETTQKMLSGMTGQYTFIEESVSTAVSKPQGFGFFNGNVTTTTSSNPTQRPLMYPDEVARLGDNMLIFREGSNAILGKKYNYREDPELVERTKIPYPEQSEVTIKHKAA